jgi:cellulose synthase/poly-beta-1,6-N-acetylglucosamine synthase-like glycosyltransferase
MSTPLVLVVLSTAACCYAYAGYPLLLLVVARLRSRPVQQAPILRSVTVICAAHNEQRTIAAKIRNTLALDFPADLLELIIASDGSTDATDDIVRSFSDPRLRLLALPRGGKMAALREAAVAARGEILLFTDANIELERAALRLLVRSFADPAVGGVGARKRFRAPAVPAPARAGEAERCAALRADTTAQGEGAYWRYDQWVKRLETAAGSLYATDGACYAIRRVLFVPVADGAQADDIAISARVALQGARLVYDDEAVCWEDAPRDAVAELRRKVRVANHTLRAVLQLRRELVRAPFYALQLVSHKLVRHLVPLFLLVLLGSSSALAVEARLAWVAVGAQLAFYVLAAAGWAGRDTAAGKNALFSIPFYFTLVNAAAALALLELLRGRRRTVWTPTSWAASTLDARARVQLSSHSPNAT